LASLRGGGGFRGRDRFPGRSPGQAGAAPRRLRLSQPAAAIEWLALGQLDALLAGTAATGRFVLVTADPALARVREVGIPVRGYAP
jgi:hypothetical protein